MAVRPLKIWVESVRNSQFLLEVTPAWVHHWGLKVVDGDVATFFELGIERETRHIYGAVGQPWHEVKQAAKYVWVERRINYTQMSDEEIFDHGGSHLCSSLGC